MRRLMTTLLISAALLGGSFSMTGCVVVAPRHAHVWIPGYWGPSHVWVGGYWRH